MRKIVFLLITFSFSIISFGQKQRFITSDNVDLYVNVNGEGIPCLYIHGGPGAGSYWMEKFAGELLEQRFKMVYLDLRGVARSSSPTSQDYSMDRLIKDFEELRSALGIKSWIIMGHSFSGTIVTAYAYKHPNAIKGIMMFNCSLNINESLTQSWIPHACELLKIEDLGYFNDTEIPRQSKLDTLFRLLKERDLTWKMAYHEKENEKIMNATFSEIPNWNHDFGKVAFSIEDFNKNFKVLCPEINIPVLFYYGKSDWMAGPNHYNGVNFPELMLWGSEVGHMPFLENKSDLAKAIDSFLAKYNFSKL